MPLTEFVAAASISAITPIGVPVPAPSPRTGVAVAELMGPHVLEPLGVDLVHGLRPRRRRPGEVRLDVRRGVLPRRALAQGRHVVHGVVHGAVRERAEFRQS